MHNVTLVELDVLAAGGDVNAARIARWAERHPEGWVTPEDFVEQSGIERWAS